jgi:L-serine kinase (ADP)
LEEATSPRGFSITAGKIPILLKLKKTEDLKPHEETVQADLLGIVKTLRRDPVLRHPIIADSASGAVLDGTHRLAALKELGCQTIPAALIDYRNPLVQVDRWFRIITGDTLQNFMKRHGQPSATSLSASEADESLLARSCYATLRDKTECLAFKSKESTPLELCRHAFHLEQIAGANDMKIVYTDNGDMDQISKSNILMSTIRLEKSEVVESCLGHYLFPPKSTRHLIPSRPLGIGVPLSWLKNPNIEEAEAEFEKHLAARRVRRLPEGSMVGSRRYMEEVFLFE